MKYMVRTEGTVFYLMCVIGFIQIVKNPEYYFSSSLIFP